MKKLASLMGAGALLLGMAAPSFAYPWFSHDDLVVNNSANLTTTVKSKVNTGFNSVFGSFVGGSVYTGMAESIGQIANTVNTNSVGCNCQDDVTLNNSANLTTTVKSKVNTGFNSVMGGMFSGGLIGTGAAGSLGVVTNVVNTNVVGN